MDSIIDLSGLVEDDSYEIVSMIVMDNENATFSLGAFLGNISNDLLRGGEWFSGASQESY
ncbi:hypothetical protein [Paenibacillus sp. FSL L8-0709]|uniref:hypothetical protein n=1 Tax=Paenibacillus sp. FSL L8-0709 TaxID=2975312 RepID=UPI0030F87A01